MLVITAEAENSQSQRFYIGPIIPQPQFMENAPHEEGNDVATSLLQGRDKEPIGRISNYNATKGAFPTHEDVALIGRGREDIRLKYNPQTEISETDITAGIRVKAHNTDNPDIIGNVVFNIENPAYIQLKHGNKLSSSGSSFVNVVGDQINLMSHKDTEIHDNLHDNSTLVNETNFDQTMSKLHPAVKGDKLVELLKLLIGSLKEHVHSQNGLQQCGDWKGYINLLNSFNVNSILSENVRLS